MKREAGAGDLGGVGGRERTVGTGSWFSLPED